MQKGYFAAAWDDISHSPHWFGKIALLGLLCFIPIFGQIVLIGYVFGWARDIAWNIHRPMPSKIFGSPENEGWGKRGGFSLVAMYLLMIPAFIVEALILLNTPEVSSMKHVASSQTTLVSVLNLIYFVLIVLTMIVSLVSMIRIAVYGKLTPGLQVPTMLKMIGHDKGGFARIVGIAALFYIILCFVASVVGMVIGIAILLALLPSAGGMLQSSFLDSAQVLALLIPSIPLFGVGLWLVECYGVFVTLVVGRAVGYWTRQFDLPAWRGPQDPLPFESGIHSQEWVARYGTSVPSTDKVPTE